MNHTGWLEGLNIKKRYLLLLAALIPPPISLDDLVSVTSTSPIKVLKFIEELVEKEVLSVYDALGRGYYYFTKPETVGLVIDNTAPKDVNVSARKLIHHFEREYQEGIKKDLTITHLFHVGEVKLKRPDRVLRSAEFCLTRKLKDIAAAYFRLVVDSLRSPVQSKQKKEAYIDAALGLIQAQGHLMPAAEQKKFLEQALFYANQLKDQNRRTMITLVYAQILKAEGNFKKASTLFERGWNLAQSLGREDLVKWAAISATEFLFWQGRVAKAVERYEQVIGNLEEFPSDQAMLRACTYLGWCYGICGQTARGMGLIEAVRDKANKSNLDEIKFYADMMSVLNLLEARHIPEAEWYLNELLSVPEESLGHYILWAANAAMAYVLYNHGDFKGSFSMQERTWETSKKLGWSHHRGPWNFEYIDGLEKAGMVHPEMNFEAEINRVLNWPDIYMKGVGLRYRAQRALEKSESLKMIYHDLNRSQELLFSAGAKLELSRTQILIARLQLRNGEHDKAKRLIEEAWKVQSAVNESMFPDDLLGNITEKDRETLLIKAMVEVGNTIGTVKEKNELLQHIINLAMRITRAERGGFFLLDASGELNLVASRNLDPAQAYVSHSKINYENINEVIRTKKEIIKTSIARNRFHDHENSELGWLICAPVILQDRILGVLYLDSNLIAVPLPEKELPLLRAIGNQVAIALDNVRSYEEIARLRDRLEEKTRFYQMEIESSPYLHQIVGKSDGIHSVLRQIQKVAPTDSSVLITGETGVGKELVAHAVHRLSTRSEGPFIPVNIASLAQGVIESELFGHERGAFTGAVKRRLGRFELADGGTLFLDEIDNLSLDIQQRILRCLEEKKFERVGGTMSITSDFRLVSATNQNLEDMIKRGHFRRDLFFRLNVFPIHIPPLRERKDDVPLIAMHFVKVFNDKTGKKVRGISESQMNQLLDYDWPGNVRELIHIIERAVILSEKGFLKIPNLKGFTNVDAENGLEKFPSFEEMERTYIIKVLESCNWRVSGENGAAKVLNLKPTTLYSKMKRLGIRKTMV
jgi:transcriptional regulator with GAF, ATPase, and Fis domain